MQYRIITAKAVFVSDTVIGSKEGVVFINSDNKPNLVPKDDVVAVLQTIERDVTRDMLGTYTEDY